MNFLGHIYLSGGNEHILIGNFIADSVKGKKYTFYPAEIQKGILFHRSIDSFTDQNNNFQNVKSIFLSQYNHYAGVVADLIIDHFLAVNWEKYSHISLENYSKFVYDIFLRNYHFLPRRIKNYLPNFIYRNRLLSYSKISGIEEALSIMSFRTSLPKCTSETIKILTENYKELMIISESFLKEISRHVQNLHINSVENENLKFSINAAAQICFCQDSIKRIKE